MTAPALVLERGLAISPLDFAVGDTGSTLRTLWNDKSEYSASVSPGVATPRSLDALQLAFAEASVASWDGEGAASADPVSYGYAKMFLQALTTTYPTPVAYVDPDGEFCLEWDFGPHSVFSVSIGRDGTLSYAGLFNDGRIHGVESFSLVIPKMVAQGISRAIAAD